MHLPSRPPVLPPLPVLGVAIVAGMLEWLALWRSRGSRHAEAALRT